MGQEVDTLNVNGGRNIEGVLMGGTNARKHTEIARHGRGGPGQGRTCNGCLEGSPFGIQESLGDEPRSRAGLAKSQRPAQVHPVEQHVGYVSGVTKGEKWARCPG